MLSACVATAQAGLDVDLVPGSAFATPIGQRSRDGHDVGLERRPAQSTSFVLTISC